MAAGKVSVVRRREFSHVSKTEVGFEYEDGKRGVFEKDCRVRVKEAMMEVDDGGVIPPPEKRRKLSPVVWCEDDAVLSRSFRGGSIYDGQEEGELVEEDFTRAPSIMMSRWVSDDDGLKENEEKGGVAMKGGDSKGRRSSPESGVTQKEGSDGSDGGYTLVVYGGGECSGSEYEEEEDDLMKVDTGDEVMDSVEETETRVCGNGSRNMLQGCRNVFDYEKLGKISEGSYGIVYKARDKKSGEMVALKKMKLGNQREGFPVYYLREINTLMSLNHPSIVNVREVVVDESAEGFDNIYMVMDYVEHDLKALMQARKQHFRQSEVKCLMLQLLEGVSYLHDNWVLHRDLKTSNLLLNNEGELKICDFGMARQYGSPLNPYTSLVVTLWYRAPELLLGTGEYSTAVDMWSVGCIMAELLTNKPLFDGKSEVEQLDKIFRILGTPNDKIWSKFSELPGSKAKFVNQPFNQLHKKFPRTSFTGSPVLSDSGLDLLSRLLTYDPEKRITADEALDHPWFQEVPLPNAKEFMPSFPADKC